MWGKNHCCVTAAFLLTVVWAAPQKDHDHGHSAEHHQHLHHGKDEPHPTHAAEDEFNQISPHNADFGFALYKKLASHPEAQGKNILFSPLSISVALSMLTLGAKGNTHSQIFSTLGYSDLTPEQVNVAYEHLLHMLDHSQDEMLLDVGNAVAVREGFKPIDKFLKDVQHYYQGHAFSVDFSTPEVAVKEVNKYIAKKTKDMITDMIKELDKDTVMMLINYMYFRGKWEEPFEAHNTYKYDFHVDENTKVTVDMMHRWGQFDVYIDKENFTSVIKLPYKGNAFMLIVLPDKGKMHEVEKHICKDHLKHWIGNLQRTFTNFDMPKYSISSSSSLADTLKEIGIVDAFSDHADFSGISEDNKLKVSKVLHQAVLRVDELGTEAAATTIVELLAGASPYSIYVNRPFLVFIVESSTRSIAFMGKITNPTE